MGGTHWNIGGGKVWWDKTPGMDCGAAAHKFKPQRTRRREIEKFSESKMPWTGGGLGPHGHWKENLGQTCGLEHGSWMGIRVTEHAPGSMPTHSPGGSGKEEGKAPGLCSSPDTQAALEEGYHTPPKPRPLRTEESQGTAWLGHQTGGGWLPRSPAHDCSASHFETCPCIISCDLY